MKAIWNNKVIAEADKAELIRIEGNWYFPPNSIKKEYYQLGETHTTCVWKGEASYFSLIVDGQTNEDAAWFYPKPKEGSTERVGKDYKDFVAFWHGVEITE